MSPRKIAEQAASFTHAAAAQPSGIGTVVDMSTGPMAMFGLQAKATTITAWSLVLEGTIDGTNYVTLLTHNESAPGDGGIIWTTVPKPVKKCRVKFVSVTGTGTLAYALLGVPN